MVALRAASGGQSSTAALTASVTKPTGAAAGDLAMVALNIKNSTSNTFQALAGWTLSSQDANAFNGTSLFKTAVYWRLLDGTETWPITFTWASTTAKFAWSAIAFSPTAGSRMVLDGTATVKVDTTGASTHTANSKAAVAASVCSVIFNCGRSSAAQATAISVTAATSWTEPANGDQSTASGTTAALSQLGVEVCYRLAQSGTVAPGASTWSQSTIGANVYHFLLAEVAAETSPQLEASGFGTFTGIGAGDTINSVTATVNQWQSSALFAAPVYELWDGTSGQIGADVTGTASTSTSNTDSPSWTGVTYSQLATLRVRVTAHSGTAVPAATQSVDWVGLTVNYTPVAGVALPELVMATRIAP